MLSRNSFLVFPMPEEPHIFLVILGAVVKWDVCIFIDYMAKRLGMDEEEIDNLSELLYKNYGTTMAGLRVGQIL